MKFYIGCSGFSYKEWKHIFYPDGLPAGLWLDFYAKNFNTLEINSTFYRTPSQKTVDNWFGQTPDDFTFSVKAPKLITHLKRFNIEKQVVQDFYSLIRNGLKQKLGCVLFQMPPSFYFSEERLDLIIEKLDPAFKNVVEFRHKSWWDKKVYSTLQEANVIFCGQSYPGDIPEEVIQNNPVVYYRFHGKPVLYKSLYEGTVLNNVVSQLTKSKKEVFIYFNNTWGESALINSKQMQKITSLNL